MTDLSSAIDTTRVQIGPLEDDNHLIVELIDSHKCAASFLEWISDSSYSRNLIHHQTMNSKYLRFCTYHVEGVLVYTARVEFYLDAVNDQVMLFLKGSEKNEKLLIPSEIEFTFKHIKSIISDPYYSVLAQIIESNEIIGMIWEIYELPQLAQVYSRKKDPLRYWKMERRE